MKTYYCAGVLTAGFLFSVVSLGQDATSVQNWPRVVDANGFHLVIYQPQVDSWKNNRLEARAAVTASRPGSTQENFGIVALNAAPTSIKWCALFGWRISRSRVSASRALNRNKASWKGPSTTRCRAGREIAR